MAKTFNTFNLPPRLFKYYSFNSRLNAQRLAGEVYLACPYDFNDPCDCQREVINNTNDKVATKGEDWLKLKMHELDYDDIESQDIASSLSHDNSRVKEVHRRMLERLGILCLTQNQADSLMWGYYANNEGMCLEYDTSRIVCNIVIGYINEMNYTTTRLLYIEDKYNQNPAARTPALDTDVIAKAESIIKKTNLKRIHNKYLIECNNEDEILNFVRNILLKRIYAQSIIYNISPDGAPSPLFFDRKDKTSETKYFKKTKTWSHEKEFRFIVSLGGRMPINIGKECIKNIYLGCNMSNERIAAIIYLMTQHNLSAGLYKMKRLKNCGLAPQKIDWEIFRTNLESLESSLSGKFPSY